MHPHVNFWSRAWAKHKIGKKLKLSNNHFKSVLFLNTVIAELASCLDDITTLYVCQYISHYFSENCLCLVVCCILP